MSKLEALASGAIGACALTLAHQLTRKMTPEAPRMDVLGMRAIEEAADRVGVKTPQDENLYRLTMAGDLVANSLFYSLVGAKRGKSAWVLGPLLGVAAGLAGVLLPGPMGLGREPSGRTRATQAMTIGLYLLGGLAAAAAARLLEGNGEQTPTASPASETDHGAQPA